MFAPIVLIAFKNDPVAGDPFHKLVWAGSTNRVTSILFQSSAFNSLLAYHECSVVGEIIQHRAKRLLGSYIDGVIIHNFGRFSIKYTPAIGLKSAFNTTLNSEIDIMRSKRISSVAHNVLAYMEADSPLVNLLPTFGQHGLKFASCTVFVKQGLIKLENGKGARLVVLHLRIQASGLTTACNRKCTFNGGYRHP